MKLFDPITIRGLTLPNRIVMAPIGLPFGLESSRAFHYYVERARGGVGAIITAATSPNLFTLDDLWGHPGGAQEYIESLRPLTKAVHESGAKIGVQLLHSSRWPDRGPASSEGEPVGPSARIEADPPTVAGLLQPGDRVRDLTLEEIEMIIGRFAKASEGVRQAGFDFVEMHLTHGYLGCQFFSPFYNRRTDKYGGDLKGRMRFGLECVGGMRRTLGDDFPLFCRLGVEDRIPGSINLQDSLEFACELVKAGVDVLDIDPAESVPYATPGSEYPMGTFVHLAEAVKHRVDIPVIAVGRINMPEVAESILKRGQADLVAVGRQLIADPFWPKKVRERRMEDIIPCLSCNTCIMGEKYHCTVNAAATWEEDFRIKPARRVKNVWVVGGGPGGMEAARVAAQRGHKVVLFEKGSSLGGQLPIAAALPEKEVMRRLKEYLAREVAKAGVEIRFNTEVTASAVIEGNPDAVIMATGATPFIPSIPGIEGNNVVLAEDVLTYRRETGDRVVIIGGELVACDTALFLAEQGKRITMVRRGPVITENVVSFLRRPVLEKLTARGVIMLTGVRYEAITPKGLCIIDRDGQRRMIESDTVVLAAGLKPNHGLAKELECRVRTLYRIGDCVEPRRIKEAIAEGARLGLEI